MMSLLVLVTLYIIYSFDLALDGWLLIGFTVLCFGSIYYELLHALKIQTDWEFISDFLLSLIAFAGVAALFTSILIHKEPLYLGTLLGGGVILLDTIALPIIAFKMAHKNIIMTGKYGF